MANTPPKINIEPENDGLEDDCPFPGGPYSQVGAVNMLIFRGVHHRFLQINVFFHAAWF